MSSKSDSDLIFPLPSPSRSFKDNLDELERQFGFPHALKWKTQKGKRIAVIEADDPVSEAIHFASVASEGYVTESRITYGYIRTMADGSKVVLRIITSSRDSPAVDLSISYENRTRKIHFVKEN